jgi:hypothetical protein
VPGVREWLLGAQQAAGSPAEDASALLVPGLGSASASRDETVSGVSEACLSERSPQGFACFVVMAVLKLLLQPVVPCVSST